jgi:hypothetical protein
VVVDISWRANLFDMAHVDNGNAIAKLQSFFLIVSDEDRRNIDLPQQSADLTPQVNSRLGVKGAKRFVKQQHFRFVSQCAGDSDPLLLTTGKL